MLVMPNGYDTALLRLSNPVHEHQLYCNTVCLYTSVHMSSFLGRSLFAILWLAQWLQGCVKGILRGLPIVTH